MVFLLRLVQNLEAYLRFPVMREISFSPARPVSRLNLHGQFEIYYCSEDTRWIEMIS